MEHDGHVRFDGESAVVSISEQIVNDSPHIALTFAGEGVGAGLRLRIPDGILDVDIGNVGPDL